jgi:hypothetical protein
MLPAKLSRAWSHAPGGRQANRHQAAAAGHARSCRIGLCEVGEFATAVWWSSAPTCATIRAKSGPDAARACEPATCAWMWIGADTTSRKAGSEPAQPYLARNSCNRRSRPSKSVKPSQATFRARRRHPAESPPRQRAEKQTADQPHLLRLAGSFRYQLDAPDPYLFQSLGRDSEPLIPEQRLG